MNARDIEAAIEEIKAVPGKNDKVDLLRKYLADESFQSAVTFMLDPRLRFGVAKKTLDKIKGGSGKNTFYESEDTIPRMLYQMSDGRLAGSRTAESLEILGKYLDAPSWSLLSRILLKKPDAGFTSSSVNKARANTIWTFDCMLAHPFEAKRVKKWPVVVEPKIDGVRCLIMVKPLEFGDYDIAFFSRTGKEFTAFDHMLTPLHRLMQRGGYDEPVIIDCEIDSGDFLATVSQARRKDVEAMDAVARCFDLLTFKDWERGTSSVGYADRRHQLELLLGKDEPYEPRFQLLPQWECHSEDEIMAHNTRIQAAGGEGVIVKPKDHRYERKRSYNWLKVKGFETHDLIITGFFEGEGKYAGKLGGVIVDYNGVDVRVGGGLTDEDRLVIWNSQDLFLGRMIEVGAHETTPDGSLRHPRFIRFRDDKHEVEAA